MFKSPKIKLLGVLLMVAGMAYDAFEEYVKYKDLEAKLDKNIDDRVEKAVERKLNEKKGA